MADFGSSEAGKKGGKARAKSMTKEERSEVARLAAEARWGTKAVTMASHVGSLRVAENEIECAVLEDGRRVLTQETFLTAIGRSAKGKGGQIMSSPDGLPPFLSATALKPFISDELRESTVPVVYRTPKGVRAFGYEAGLLPKVCETYLKARDAGLLTKQQAHIAKACDILMRGLAHVGIIALVDEATGYQRDRARDELAKILEAFVAKEIQKWISTFELEFYELICDLRGLPLERAKKRPRYFGCLTNNLVYARLAPGVLEELKKMSPPNESGRRKTKLFQGLTLDHGYPRLKEHLAGVTSAMKFAKVQGMDWDKFLVVLDKTHPKYKDMPLFDGIEDESN